MPKPSNRPGVRAALLLIAVFLAGAIVGVAFDRLVLLPGPRFALLEEARSEDLTPLVNRLERTLDLDAGQVTRVRATLEGRRPRFQAIWETARSGVRAQLDSTLAELGAVLTPDQRDELLSRLRRRGVEGRDSFPAIGDGP